MIGWLRRRIVAVTPLRKDGSRDWSSGFVSAWDQEIWWRPGQRGLILRSKRFQVALTRRYAYLARTDHSTYLKMLVSRGC